MAVSMKNKMKPSEMVNAGRQTMESQDIQIAPTRPINAVIYGASIASILLSLMTVRRSPSLANFFGLWAPTILGLGILFKENRILDLEHRHAI